MTASLYEDKMCGRISDESFRSLIQKNEHERQSKTARLDELMSVVKDEVRKTSDIRKWVEIMRKYLSVESIDRAMVDELVERIIVGEKIRTESGARQDVTVVYRFVGRI